MGLFDRFLGKKDEPKEIRDLVNYSEDLKTGEKVSVSGLSRKGAIKHRDNSQTEIILGKIIKVPEGHAIMVDEEDYIAFEVPKGRKITEDVLHSVISQYDMEKASSRVSGKTCYLGRLEDTRSGVVFGNKSVAVENMVRQRVETLENERKELIQDEYQRNQAARLKAEEIVVAQRDMRISEEQERMNREKASRLSNPTLICTGRQEVDGKICMDYDGVDMQTGDILRLRRVDKICKNQYGQYLYTAYVSSVEHEHDANLFNEFGEPEGSLVAFVLPGRLEDFVQAGRPDQIGSILNLLSNGKNLARQGKMSYIGQIDKTGAIRSDIAIGNAVKQLQDQYAMKHARTNKNFSEDDGR